MSEQHVAPLRKARERLVEDRRAFARIVAAPFERERTHDARVKFVEIQAAMEALESGHCRRRFAQVGIPGTLAGAKRHIIYNPR